MSTANTTRTSKSVESHLTGLRCRECGAACPAEARSACEQCFGPLEPAYNYDGIRAAVTRESIARGPTTLWR
jgi:threonine synthase